jgi:hypothetical protein
MKRQVSVLLVILTTALARSQAPVSTRVARLGGIAGETGMVASLNRLVTVYSDNTIRVQSGTDLKWKIVEHSGPVSFEVKDEEMKRTQDNVPLAVAHDFSFCDALNQVDISRTVDRGILSILPKGALIKATERLSDNVTLVVYAESDSPVRYGIRVAMFQSKLAHKYSIVGEDTVTIDGNYCGMQSLGGNYRLILVDEPAGSSDFSAAFVYALRP